jgi:hypothetical protein
LLVALVGHELLVILYNLVNHRFKRV